MGSAIGQYVPPVSPKLELWANCFHARMLGDAAGMAATANYFPNASTEIDDMFADVPDAAKERLG